MSVGTANGRRDASVGLRNARKRTLETTSQPPWKAWKVRSRHGRAIKFIETYCRTSKGRGHGMTMKLAPFQKEFLEEVLANGVDASVLTTPRGNGKSTFGGALAVWALFDDDETGAPQIPIVATTISQAILSCYGVAAAMVRAAPELVDRALIYTGVSVPRIVYPGNNGELFPKSHEAEGLQGLDFTLAIFDEIGFQPMESWDSLRMASGKRERSLIIGLGTRGLDTDNALHRLLQIKAEGAIIPGFVVREYSAPLDCKVDDREVWRVANPALRKPNPFLRESALETDIALATSAGGAGEGNFRIFRLNQPWEGVDSWLGRDGRKVWDALAEPYEFVDKAPTWVGLDVGLTRDSTAVVWVQKRPDGRLHAKRKIWLPPAGEAINLADVRAFIRELSMRYKVVAVSFDPRFFADSAQMLDFEKVPMVEIPQTIERMTPACGNLLSLIKHADVTHDGEPDFATQVLNAVPYPNERGFTLKKSRSRGRIDACIALALAVDRATLPVKQRTKLFVSAA